MSRPEKFRLTSGVGVQPPESLVRPQREQDPNESEDDVELCITLDDQDCKGEEHRRKRKRGKEDEEEQKEAVCDFDETLDQALEDRAKQHNLTAVNVRNIIHEVITNEHVVAMMKAAITETEDMPMFEPKMTRSKLKEVVEKGVVIPTWNLSPIKKVSEVKAPQFVDIPLEEDDSSDEEYRPEEGEEDETAEESLLESDVESTASSPRGHKRPKVCHLPEAVGMEEEDESVEGPQEPPDTPGFARYVSADVVPMGPPPPPKSKPTQDSTFMEKLHAVDAELAFSPMCMDSYQSLDESLIAFRTRSKRPLKDVPIGQLEAKLKAPDITPDMYEQNTADDDEWKKWLRSLMEDDMGNEDEGDDEDDPEYNILEDLDEPDTEDLRNDRAVRITKKEVSELMEELFETFQDEMGFSHVEEEGPDEDSNQEALPNFNTPQAIRFEEPLANLLNEQHRTVKAQLESLRLRKSLMKPQCHGADESTPAPEEPKAPPPAKAAPVMFLDETQRRRLQQQMQQHVQLLTQMHLLTCQNHQLSQQADLSRMFLVELSSFAEKSTMLRQMANPEFQSAFQPWNLKEALQLLHDFHQQLPEEGALPKPLKKNASEAASLPTHMAWIMATRPLFMYPELLPICALKAKGPRDRVYFTKAEDNLLALGLKHFEGTDYYKPLISKYLVTGKSAQQLTVRIKNLTMKKTPENIIKFYKRTKLLPVMLKFCDDAQSPGAKAPVEREKHRLPFWLKANLSSIEEEFGKYKKGAQTYPLTPPPGLQLNMKPLPQRFLHRSWRQKRSSILKPLLIRPTSNIGTNCPFPKTVAKMPSPDPFPIGLYARVSSLVQPQPAVQGLVGIHPADVPAGGKSQEVRATLPFAARPSRLHPPPVAPVPIAPAKVLQPAMLNQRARRLLGGMTRRRTAVRNPAIKAAPLVHSAPVIFAVPSATLKLVSLGSPCGVIQPISSRGGVPVTTLLLNPPPVPVSQTLVPSALSQTPRAEPERLVGGDTTEGQVQSEGGTTFKEEDEWDCVSITIKVKEEGGLVPGGHTDCGGEGTSAASHIKKERVSPFRPGEKPPQKENCPFYLTEVPLEPGSECDPPECEQRGGAQTCESGSGLCEQQGGKGPRELGDEGQAVGHASGTQEPSGSSAGQRHRDHTLGKEGKTKENHGNRSSPSPAGLGAEPDEKEETEDVAMEEEDGGNETQNPDAAESPKNTSSSTDGDVDISSPAGTPLDSSSPSGRPESANDKDGPEEEEEEDFDDLTQDEDEEEISSASEESVLSVPELQETMEKLTWLASERRLSQEGDSEENSQEENSEQEEEEEEEGDEGIEPSSQKEEEMTDEVAEGGTESAQSHLCPTLPMPVETRAVPAGERRRGSSRGPGSHRVRSRRGRARTSKDASKLLLLYDENILAKDPLREQKDMAFAQCYLTRVREALQYAPGRYEEFLQLIYQFESSRRERTAVDLYERLRGLLRDWPQLLRDFAAFLLPEEALECGLFEEQQAFDKSRKFLRQLEICFMENPAQHQKIIKLLQSCAECPLQEITKLKAQMWQLLRGHNHLQDEFSMFFDQLRPPASRLGEFEVMTWTEDKEYKFDGYEEVTLPDVEEEEESGKVAAPRTKRKKDQDKVCDSRAQRARDPPEVMAGGLPRSLRQGPTMKEVGKCNHGNMLPSWSSVTNGSCLSAPGEGALPPRDTQDRLSAELPVGQRGSSDTSGSNSNMAGAQRARGSTHSRAPSVPGSTSLGKPRPGTRDSPRTPAPPHPRSSRRPLCMKDPDQPPNKLLPSSTAPPRELNPPVPSVSEQSLASIILCSTPSAGPGTDPLDPNSKESPDPDEQTSTVCAKNITVSSSGEKVILWTREADRVILTMCQERGAQPDTFADISQSLGNKSADEVSRRFQDLVSLFQTACVTSSDEEEEAGSTAELLSDQEVED